MLIDTHVHLNNERLLPDVEKVIQKAKTAGVAKFFVVGWDVESSKTAIKLAETYEEVYAIVGIHPSDSVKYESSVLGEIEKMLNHEKVIAVGEIGLDYHWIKDEGGRSKQREFFIAQIKLANKYNLPVSIHMRDAAKDTYDVLEKHRPKKGGVMNCYSSSVEMAEMFINLGMYISLGGPVTFTNAKMPKRVASQVPLDKLLIETDAPYLTPHPYRGKLNEPALLPLIAKQIAKIKNVSYEEVIKRSSENAIRLFRVKQNA